MASAIAKDLDQNDYDQAVVIGAPKGTVPTNLSTIPIKSLPPLVSQFVYQNHLVLPL